MTALLPSAATCLVLSTPPSSRASFWWWKNGVSLAMMQQRRPAWRRRSMLSTDWAYHGPCGRSSSPLRPILKPSQTNLKHGVLLQLVPKLLTVLQAPLALVTCPKYFVRLKMYRLAGIRACFVSWRSTKKKTSMLMQIYQLCGCA